MSKPKYDDANQYNRVKRYVIPGETLEAVFDCKGGGTGFVGVSDQRIIFYDQGFFTKKKSMVSVPYHQVIAVASADEGAIFKSSELTVITAAGNFTFQFRGSDKAHWAYNYIMNQILNQVNPQLPDKGNLKKLKPENREEFKGFCLICQKPTMQYYDTDGKIRCSKCGEVVPEKV